MFDIGFSELLVIAIVALVVLGPERMPKAARFAGLWVRRARNQWDSVKQELERELHAEDIKRQMQEVRQSMQDTGNELRASGEAARRHAQALDAAGRELAEEVRPEAVDPATTMVGPAPVAAVPGTEPVEPAAPRAAVVDASPLPVVANTDTPTLAASADAEPSAAERRP